jgi:co-chaperonin GroES (HSP10)
MSEPVVDLEERRKASQLPQPCGYQLLVALSAQEEKTEGGVYVPEEWREREETAGIAAMVLRMGPDAFTDKSRFPSGAYCKDGDWIIMKAYSGFRVEIHGQQFRLINDDCVRAVIEDPRGVKRA